MDWVAVAFLQSEKGYTAELTVPACPRIGFIKTPWRQGIIYVG